MLKAANDPVGGTPERVREARRAATTAKYARLAKELGIKGEREAPAFERCRYDSSAFMRS